ncbi:hypothetical protein Acor_50870 [Acrocarpospora corrugata]|uniref:Uncharacterized protein n=2 Tax=Acrocarpospora corrugata TaxID=35763 RepID=A0A5M3W745_9ACTN|nr:hypothetical protein [Acrocarpospora corrugata]GES03021.1 hypothetical protein Acor_50870 [Acrocarpospora corrugata]
MGSRGSGLAGRGMRGAEGHPWSSRGQRRDHTSESKSSKPVIGARAALGGKPIAGLGSGQGVGSAGGTSAGSSAEPIAGSAAGSIESSAAGTTVGPALGEGVQTGAGLGGSIDLNGAGLAGSGICGIGTQGVGVGDGQACMPATSGPQVGSGDGEGSGP